MNSEYTMHNMEEDWVEYNIPVGMADVCLYPFMGLSKKALFGFEINNDGVNMRVEELDSEGCRDPEAVVVCNIPLNTKLLKRLVTMVELLEKRNV